MMNSLRILIIIVILPIQCQICWMIPEVVDMVGGSGGPRGGGYEVVYGIIVGII